jgi:uncharacterized protein
MSTPREFKLLFAGTMGAGKTTAIGAISEIDPIVTDVQNNDATVAKLRTTVGLDYGEFTLESGDKVRLYGTPGQERFSFIWPILAKGAMGLILLIDNSRSDPLADFALYMKHFASFVRETGCVVGVGRSEECPVPSLDAFGEKMMEFGVVCPVLAVDVRKREDVLMMMDLLLTQLESKAWS